MVTLMLDPVVSTVCDAAYAEIKSLRALLVELQEAAEELAVSPRGYDEVDRDVLIADRDGMAKRAEAEVALARVLGRVEVARMLWPIKVPR
jgi:hypothetical protein